MATKIKGITIEFNADATGLEKALKDIDKTLSQTQKDLKAVDKALKLDPKNIDLIEQKQRLLGTTVDQTKAKLKSLKEAQQQIKWDDTEKAQRQYDALTREISETEVKLKSLNTEQKEFTREAAKAKAEATNFGQALSSIQEKANKVAEATAQMSAAAAAALTGMVALVTKASQFADDMLTMSQQTGLSTDSLQKMAYAAERIDVPMETIVGSVNKMKTGLDKNEDVYQRLGVLVKDQRGQYRDIESIFFETVGALGRIENETERDTVAMELFGRSASELSGIIDDSGAALRDLGNEAENLGLIVSEEDLAKLGEFNDKLEAMKSQLQMAGVQAALPILEAMQPVITAISSAITKVSAVLANMNPTILRILTIVLAIIAAIAPVAKTIATITMAIQGLSVAIPLVSAAIGVLNGTLMTLLANPVTWVVLAVIAVLGLLIVTIYQVVQAWKSLGDTQEERAATIQTAFENMRAKGEEFGRSLAQTVHNGVQQAMTAINDFASRASTYFQPVINGVRGLWEAFLRIPEKIQSVGTKIHMWFEDIIQKAKTSGRNVLKSFTDGFSSFINNMIQAFQKAADAIKSIWDKQSDDALSAGLKAGKNYSAGYNATAPKKTSSSASSFSSMGTSSAKSASMSSFSLDRLYSELSTLNSNLSGNTSQPTQVNVELVGSAKNIFDTVRVQNNVLKTATGYHALA